VPDVGHEFDERLGTAFDRRLAVRLWHAARPHRALIAGSLGLFPLIAAVELAQPYLLKVAIDDHILKGDWLGLTWIAGLYVGVLGLLYVLRWLEAYLMNLTGQRVIHDLRAALFAHLLRLEAAFFDRNPVGRLMTRVLGDVEAVSEAFTSGLFAVVADVITLVGVVGVMLWLDWHLALVTFSIVPALFVAAGYFRLRARDAYRTVRQRLAHLNGLLQESLQGMAVIQLFARERHEAGRFREANRAYRRALFTSMIYEASLYASVEALGSIALAVLLWYGGGQPAPSPSACWSRSSSTRTGSSCPSVTSAPSTRSCSPRWRPRSGSSVSSTDPLRSSRSGGPQPGTRGPARPPSSSKACGSPTRARPGCCATAR